MPDTNLDAFADALRHGVRPEDAADEIRGLHNDSEQVRRVCGVLYSAGMKWDRAIAKARNLVMVIQEAETHPRTGRTVLGEVMESLERDGHPFVRNVARRCVEEWEQSYDRRNHHGK